MKGEFKNLSAESRQDFLFMILRTEAFGLKYL